MNSLKIALEKLSLNCEAEKEFTVYFEGEIVGKFRVDLVVENNVIVEIKSIEGAIPKIFEAQVISYLKASRLKVGLLINFGNESCHVRRLIV